MNYLLIHFPVDVESLHLCEYVFKQRADENMRWSHTRCGIHSEPWCDFLTKRIQSKVDGIKESETKTLPGKITKIPITNIPKKCEKICFVKHMD